MAGSDKGDCYEVHARFLRDEVDRAELNGWRLFHGTVTNGRGQSIGHCWLEHNGFVYDLSNGTHFEIEANEFREMTQARNIIGYTSEEVSVNIITQGHYGPWK